MILAARSDAQSQVKQVLVLQTSDRGNLVLDYFTRDFRVGMEQHARTPVNLVQVVVGPTGFVRAPEQAIVDYIRSVYADGARPDLVVTVGGPAALFARKNRQQLFPETPLLFASVDQRWIRDAPLGETETAVAVLNDFPRIVDDILHVLPETKEIFIVVGTGPIGAFWRQELAPQFERFRDRVKFVWSNEPSLPEILHRVANLPPHSAIFYLTFGADARGGAYADEQVLAALHANANAPLFGPHSVLLGYGIVGGSLMPIADLGRSAGEVAGRILNGEPPASLRLPPHGPDQRLFDWRELEKWDIPMNRLPPGSVVRYRPPTLWEEHSRSVLSAVAGLVLQALLIAWLLFERRARQHAEIESRRNLSLAADANRRETVSALTASIGHELGQPLSAIVFNAQALRMMVTSQRAAPEAAGEILADIQSEAVLATRIIERHRSMLRSHELQKKPIDAHTVIEETLALVAHDMRARQIEVILELSSTSCIIDGDHVLLEQVLVNLLRNAIDALVDTAPAKRYITIRSEVRDADLEVSVSDTGMGLSAEIIGRLFTPFVTTKSNGLGIGLTITQRLVEAHGGTIAACANIHGGATFTVTLPRSATTESPGVSVGEAGFYLTAGVDAAIGQ